MNEDQGTPPSGQFDPAGSQPSPLPGTGPTPPQGPSGPAPGASGAPPAGAAGASPPPGAPGVPPRYGGGAPPRPVPPPYYQPYAQYAYPPHGAPPPKKKGGRGWLVALVLLLLFGGGGALLLFILASVLGPSSSSSAGGGSILGGPRIGLVRIEGVIMQDAQKEFWMESLRNLADDHRVRGIVLRIDSPGGSVGAAQEIYEYIIHLRSERGKPVYVSMGDTCASGGYYIAAAADRIFSLKGTLTGSIGVIFTKPELSELADRLGYETEVVKSGRFKDSGAMTRPMSPEERRIFEILIQDTYEQFIQDILAFRDDELRAVRQRMTPADFEALMLEPPLIEGGEGLLRSVADGRAYSGQQAHELGLVDEIGTLDDVIAALARRLQITGRPRIEEPRRELTFRDMLFARVDHILPRASSQLFFLMDRP
ncbi:MAG TPA: signal peptide peptidase SppA [Candidatus Sumerlaeota bacterium]|nr:signal peptide peptidase SppA [Candidatus Sumerlaeota bacterium]HPK03208.1 signal peptide peptidase SppA [Candidatus Sumerlaeota bacterium]